MAEQMGYLQHLLLPLDGAGGKEEIKSYGSQMTIFYAGSVSVFDSISPEKAQAILLIAAAAAAAGPALSRSPSTVSSTGAAPSPLLPEQALAQGQQQVVAPSMAESLCKIHAELPLARRNSLQRFLEKRRERLVSMAPYSPMQKAPDSPPESCSGGEPSSSLYSSGEASEWY